MAKHVKYIVPFNLHGVTVNVSKGAIKIGPDTSQDDLHILYEIGYPGINMIEVDNKQEKGKKPNTKKEDA